MNSSYLTAEIAHQRTADYIADADNARLAKALRKAAKRDRAAADTVAGGSKTVYRAA